MIWSMKSCNGMCEKWALLMLNSAIYAFSDMVDQFLSAPWGAVWSGSIVSVGQVFICKNSLPAETEIEESTRGISELVTGSTFNFLF